VDQHHGHVEPPPHAPGVGLGRPAGRVGQPELVQQVGGPAAQPPAAQPVQAGLQGQVLLAGQQADGAAVLADRADDRADPAGVAQHVDPGHRGPAGVRAGQRGQDPHGGGLAGAVRAEQGVHAAGPDGEAQPVQRADAALEGLAEVLGLEGVIRVRHGVIS
jgi:hypothetical protein